MHRLKLIFPRWEYYDQMNNYKCQWVHIWIQRCLLCISQDNVKLTCDIFFIICVISLHHLWLSLCCLHGRNFDKFELSTVSISNVIFTNKNIYTTRVSVLNHEKGNVWSRELTWLEHSVWIRMLWVSVHFGSRHFCLKIFDTFTKNLFVSRKWILLTAHSWHYKY